MLNTNERVQLNEVAADLQDVCAHLWDVAFAITEDKKVGAESVRNACSELQAKSRVLRDLAAK